MAEELTHEVEGRTKLSGRPVPGRLPRVPEAVRTGERHGRAGTPGSMGVTLDRDGCGALIGSRLGDDRIQLAVENEEGFWGDTGERTANLVRTVAHPALGVNWDPGNAFCAGDEPFPAGYDAVRDLVRHVHFKDARRGVDGVPAYVAAGEIDWDGQVQALAADGYDGFISVETHLRPKVGTARDLLQRLRQLVVNATV